MNKVYVVMSTVTKDEKAKVCTLGAFTSSEEANEIVDNINKDTVEKICGRDSYIIKAWVLELDLNKKVNIAIY